MSFHVASDPLPRSTTLPRNRRRRCASVCGQASVELALIVPLLTIVMVLGIQFAIIGTASLSLGQMNYQGARYAAVNTSATESDVKTYMLSVSSPVISAGGGKYLTATLTPAPPCSFGASVTVSVTFDTSHLVVLPNPFLGISFPTSLSSSESAFCE